MQHVVSLGARCYPSWVLKGMGMKTWSGPFDWIFSSRKMALHCLEDDFGTFLDARYYSRVPEDRRFDDKSGYASHDFYAQYDGVYPVFNHHDVTQPEAYAYLARCVDRFRTALKSADPVLLVQMFDATADDEELFLETVDCLRSYGRRTRLLCIAVGDPVEGGGALTQERSAGTSRLYRMTPQSAWLALEFADHLDDGVIKDLVARTAGDVPRLHRQVAETLVQRTRRLMPQMAEGRR